MGPDPQGKEQFADYLSIFCKVYRISSMWSIFLIEAEVAIAATAS